MESESSTSSLLEALYTTSTKRTFRVTAYTKTELGSNPCQKEGRLARTAQYKHHASPRPIRTKLHWSGDSQGQRTSEPHEKLP